ncbi:cell division cycle 20-like protein 1, cofactor of APC complex [Fistulifera solaris]|uniref:Cell division cycle 20-like protein 1, cofactor of APC complex n=1 Tax=Fistulifera solaris TaxID=1519565 RepID=A0A1Z5KA62_FISSO|nr:cell division cycle 20-like protein 1, cofactor of APC complex [Fistulifera solaris]|eukprot:GAX23134.1 cell division cycle 20-like protein 1, cofactor of APC complex [Fistulifera solaris]
MTPEEISSTAPPGTPQTNMMTGSHHKHLLTPMTLSCSDSMTSPLDTSMESTDDSLATTATTSTTTANQTRKVWVPLPSPSRPRLEPRYAMRLAPELVRAHHVEETADLVPPPGVTRSTLPEDNSNNNMSSIFRPSPIVTSFSPTAVTPSSTTFSYPEDSTPYTFAVSPRYHSTDRGCSDRFIPNRATSNFSFNLWESRRRTATPTTSHSNRPEDDTTPHNAANPTTTTQPSHQSTLNSLLRSELLHMNENYNPNSSARPLREGTTNSLRYQSARQIYQNSVLDAPSILHAFHLTPGSMAASQRLSPPKRKRRISKVPFKVLDAPALQDDFYLNLVDWSSQNVLAVGLASCVYLWSACTSKVTKLCDLSSNGADDHSNNNNNNNNEDVVTSVSWAQRGTHLAIGTSRGHIQLWDTVACQKIRDLKGHDSRVGALAWSGPCLASGSRDRLIYLRDVRAQGDFTDRLPIHRQEVCGLKWSYDEPAFLASGGNDNVLHVIDSRNPGQQPLHRFADHTAAVKAITWSPHQHGLLASGGGTADRCIRFWNTLSGTPIQKIDTGSQVCNLAWSQNCNEIVSTHGYSQNQIVVWRYPTMQKVTTLTGHTYRVLYLAVSPDGSTVVTGAGDETLRFWQVFPGPRSDGKGSAGSLLFPNTLGSVIR